MRLRSVMLTLSVMIVISVAGTSVPGQSKSSGGEGTNLLALKVIGFDQMYARQTINQYDRNEDRRLDSDEMRRLKWSNKPTMFDVDKDGHLTITELAIRFAYRRNEVGVTKVDQQAASRFMGRYDKNRDRRLNADEVRDGQWPKNPDEFDADKDGLLTPFEIATRFAHNRRERNKRGVAGTDQTNAIQTVNRYDKNKDRRLDADEIGEAGLLDKIADFDADKDGHLTIAELICRLRSSRTTRDLLANHRRAARRH